MSFLDLFRQETPEGLVHLFVKRKLASEDKILLRFSYSQRNAELEFVVAESMADKCVVAAHRLLSHGERHDDRFLAGN